MGEDGASQSWQEKAISITIMSDTHNRHGLITDIPDGGFLLIHAGDATQSGLPQELESFCEWFSSIPNYKYKIFVPGNHDFRKKYDPKQTYEIVSKYKDIICLKNQTTVLEIDTDVEKTKISICGVPFRPQSNLKQFFDKEIHILDEDRPKTIDMNADILITHEPNHSILDISDRDGWHKGAKWMKNALQENGWPHKIHIFGHIHERSGYLKLDGIKTHFFNASVLDDEKKYAFKPKIFLWNPKTNQISLQ